MKSCVVRVFGPAVAYVEGGAVVEAVLHKFAQVRRAERRPRRRHVDHDEAARRAGGHVGLERERVRGRRGGEERERQPKHAVRKWRRRRRAVVCSQDATVCARA